MGVDQLVSGGDVNDPSYTSITTDYQTINNSVTYPDGTVVTDSPGGIWEEDGNSPVSISGKNSETVNLSGSYDLVMVSISQPENETTNEDDLEIQVNGDTGTNYDVVNNDGSISADESSVSPLILDDGGEPGYAIIKICGRWKGKCVGEIIGGAIGGAYAKGFNNTSVTSPLSSITVFTDAGNNFSADLEILGRDIG